MQETKIYRPSALAEFDIEEIFDYTINEYGQNQADRYTAELYSRFQWLADNLKIGLNRDEVKEGYRSYFQGSHTIFFRETIEGIEIIGIPHQSEDIEQNFDLDSMNPSYKDLLDQHTNMTLDESDEEPEIPKQANDDLEM